MEESIYHAFTKRGQNSLKQSSLGVIIKLQESDYVWAAQTVHHFLTHQLAIKRKNEFWTLIGGQPVRLSLHEFADITEMNYDPLPKENCDVDHTVFWGEYFELKTPEGIILNHGPKFDELKDVLSKCRSWDPKERKMLARLCILSVGVYGISPGSRIPFDAATRVLDPETFDEYPWGRVAFSSMVDSIKEVCFERSKSYVVRGCGLALLIWAYESFPALGAKYGNKKKATEVPLLSWGGSRKRFKFEQLFEEKRRMHNKIRVRHLIHVPEEAIYPTWDDDCSDEELDTMIKDILNGKLDTTVWDDSAKAAGDTQKKGK